MSDLLDGGMGAAREKFKELATFRLEYIENAELDEEWKEICGKKPEDLHFFSEVCLYSLLGKDIARSMLARMHALGEALGFSRMEQHRDFKTSERDGKDLPNQDDLDALECVLRDEAIFLLGSEPEKKILPFMRALGLMREIIGAKDFTDGVTYHQLHPKDLRVGDRIADHGRWIEVLGFFDKDKNLCDTPVPDKVKENDREVYNRKTEKYEKQPYWGAHIKTCEDDVYGWPVRSQDKYVVQRKKEAQ